MGCKLPNGNLHQLLHLDPALGHLGKCCLMVRIFGNIWFYATKCLNNSLQSSRRSLCSQSSVLAGHPSCCRLHSAAIFLIQGFPDTVQTNASWRNTAETITKFEQWDRCFLWIACTSQRQATASEAEIKGKRVMKLGVRVSIVELLWLRLAWFSVYVWQFQWGISMLDSFPLSWAMAKWVCRQVYKLTTFVG